MSAAYTLDENPEGGIYSLDESPSWVAFADFSRYFAHAHEVAKGLVVADVKGLVIGKCLKIGKRYKKRGHWVTIQGPKRNHFAPLTSCVGTPTVNNFYREKKSGKWFKVVELSNKMAKMYQVLVAASNDESSSDDDVSKYAKQDVNKLFSSGESDGEPAGDANDESDGEAAAAKATSEATGGTKGVC